MKRRPWLSRGCPDWPAWERGGLSAVPPRFLCPDHVVDTAEQTREDDIGSGRRSTPRWLRIRLLCGLRTGPMHAAQAAWKACPAHNRSL